MPTFPRITTAPHLLMAVSVVWTLAAEYGSAELLEQQLLREGAAKLAAAARRYGDAQRGAILFHQRDLGCAICHLPDVGRPTLGPELTKPRDDATDAYLVEAVLEPSKTVRKGFESIQIVTNDGRNVAGLLTEELPDAIVLRNTTGNFDLIRVAKDAIDERATSPVSAMPAGLANQLAGREQFLDLMRYMFEISEYGPQRVAQLRPPPGLYATRELPEYERHLDHAGLIAELDATSFKRGEAIYSRVCVNCHGTKNRPGSLPTSLRFASDRFKNGSDPYSIYRTLTHGFGLMVPQTWMVPQEKYDVIHYLREVYLKGSNPSQYVRIDPAYLASVPKGDTRGPEPKPSEPWAAMDYGPTLINTYEVGDDGSNFAYKGIAVRLDRGPGGVSHGRQWMIFDHDTLRVAAVWTHDGGVDERFIDYNGIHFNGRHQVHPRIAGRLQFVNRSIGWANPETGNFDDVRLLGRDGEHYGPLPRKWGHFNGFYHHTDHVVLSYTVGSTDILETPAIVDAAGTPLFTRTFDIGSRANDLVLQVAEQHHVVAGVSPGLPDARWENVDGQLRLRIPAGKERRRFAHWMSEGDNPTHRGEIGVEAIDLNQFVRGGPPRWPQVLRTQAILGPNDGPFAVDVLTLPVDNPWSCQLRLTGIDFIDEGRAAAVCTWDGDVWLVRGVDDPEVVLSWQRIASGLFQPLGLKVVGGKIYVGCRDQIVALHDLNGDGETDVYENFNSDHQVTEHFHEFAMGLQTDAQGNFYYAKSARHALPAVVPHHGTLLRVARDGSRTDILATGFRAANGVCLNDDGTFFVTDQEGHWTPKNRINWVEPGGFYGNLFGYHNVAGRSDQSMRQPLCWITNSFDRSPGELLWVTSDAWTPLTGSLLELSYGAGKIFVVPHEKIGGQMQGGMCALPIPVFPTGVMRGRFHPTNGQLYACGMFAWAGNQTTPGGLYRIRRTHKPLYVPVALNARHDGIAIKFTGPLMKELATDPRRYTVRTWSLKRTENYGSDHYNEQELPIESAALSNNESQVFLKIPGIRPTWCMSIEYRLRAADGTPVVGEIDNTIHRLGATTN